MQIGIIAALLMLLFIMGYTVIKTESKNCDLKAKIEVDVEEEPEGK